MNVCVNHNLLEKAIKLLRDGNHTDVKDEYQSNRIAEQLEHELKNQRELYIDIIGQNGEVPHD